MQAQYSWARPSARQPLCMAAVLPLPCHRRCLSQQLPVMQWRPVVLTWPPPWCSSCCSSLPLLLLLGRLLLALRACIILRLLAGILILLRGMGAKNV